MDKISTHEVPTVPVRKYADPDLNAFSEHFLNSEGYENEVLGNLLEDTNEDTVLRILAHFNENLKEGSEKLQGAISQSNSETVWKTAHKIAGSAELLGFRDYANRSRELSRVVRASPDFTTHAEEIDSYLQATKNLSAEISATCPGLSAFL
jgi:HPt (histidine-containing phosphotransfer) domain-containing protein